jgi:hypothetical protein
MNTRKTVYCRAGTEEVTYANHSRRKEQGVENTGAEHEEISGKTDVGLHRARARLRLSGTALHAELPVLGCVRDLHIACGKESGHEQMEQGMSNNETPNVCQLQRDLWEMRKDYKTDMLVHEQDILHANRRIERIEKSMTQGTERTNREQSWYCLQERIEALETYRMDSNAVEARQNDDINRLKGRVGDLHEGVLKLEERLKDSGLATSFVKDAWRKDINERISELEKRVGDVHTRITGCYDDLNGKIAVIEDRTDGLQLDKVDKATRKDDGARYEAEHYQMGFEERLRALAEASKRLEDRIHKDWCECGRCQGERVDAILNDILDICKATRQRVIDSEDVITDWYSKMFREVLDFPIETRKIIAEEVARVTCFPQPEGKRLIITLEDDSEEFTGFKTEARK